MAKNNVVLKPVTVPVEEKAITCPLEEKSSQMEHIDYINLDWYYFSPFFKHLRRSDHSSLKVLMLVIKEKLKDPYI